MTIQLTCGCGRLYKIPDEHAGKRTKCKACGAVHLIPDPGPQLQTEAHLEDGTEVIDALEQDGDATEVMTSLGSEQEQGTAGAKRKVKPVGQPGRDESQTPSDREKKPGAFPFTALVISAVVVLLLGLITLLLMIALNRADVGGK